MKPAKSKSLGQIAYDAWKWPMTWHFIDMGKERNNDWERAAKAVEREVKRRMKKR